MNRAQWESRAAARRIGRDVQSVLLERARRDWIERNKSKESRNER